VARAGQQVQGDQGRLGDRISVGVLAKAFPRQAVEEAVDAAGAREQRSRMLPAWLTVYFVLALALFMDMGAGRVMRKLAGVLAWAERGVAVAIPSEEALSNARTRLGPAPLRLLFEKAAGMLAGPGTPGAFWRGRRLVSLDGTTLDAQDTGPNWAHFGGPSTKGPSGKRLRGAFPQVRLLALAECGTRALIAAVTGGYRAGEKTLARQLLPRLAAGMLLLADANFACWQLWRDAAATGADLLWRAGAALSLPVDEVLPDGTYLSRLKAPRHLRRHGAADITVRVIEYRLEDASGEVTETFTLITTLLDPGQAPARELAELYHARWEIETALGAFKTEMKGAGMVLRSKTPAGAEQEIWALLCAYHAIRELICAAAALARQDPLRISFVNALDTVRGPIGNPGAFPPSPG
jgi:transposase IS4-like protein/DDE family transposase